MTYSSEIPQLDSIGDVIAGIPDLELTLPDLDSQKAAASVEDFFADSKRKAWHEENKIEARCDFSPGQIRLVKRGVFFISIWKKSVFGRTLSEIKADPDMISFFAKHVTAIIREVMGQNRLDPKVFAVVSSPKRRHKTNNFAAQVAQMIADNLRIPFFDDCATCRNRQRINAVFDPLNIPPQPNIIVFDDFVTTGSTLAAMRNLLVSLGKNCIFFTGINNA